ncbi:MAG TPA: SdrD B-like domain-containing protein, partial [Microbacterium sp.]|nr:SdrD B-like domain-containing protein [Microbacterium sp.]
AVIAGVTGADGNFVLAPDATLAGGRYRIEVVIPAAYDHLEPAFAALGETYRSHVGFVDVSAGADATYRTAVWNPADYIQAAPAIAVPFQSGQGAVGTTQALVEFPTNPRGNTPPRTTTNTQGQVGNIYGTAYDRYEERLFSSAYAKRHTQYGPGGSGAIYVSPLGSASAELFATIPNAGDTVHTTPLRSDVTFFTAPGRESLGDIELSEDGTTLWVVNLNDQNLYELDAATGDIRGNAPIPDPGCVGGSWHPMGLGVQDGKVYVGGICDAYDSQLRSDLMASVYESTDGVSFTKVLDHSLDFLRGRANDPGVVDVNTHWNPWYDQFDPTKYYSAWVHAFPQPLLSDIDFDRDGSILLGFRDRFGDQIGYDGLAPDGRHEGSGSSAAGDIIKVCLDGGSYVWEGEGACPSNVIPTYHGGTANSLTSEYFVGESALGTNHQEPGLGSIAPLFRDNDVIMTTIDPLSGAWQQGVQYLDLDDGTGIHAQSGRGGNSRGQLLSSGALTFGKGNGLGDLSILVDPAPIQIGNVVWFDEDKDGTQDPNEVPLPGVTVDLLAADGTTVLATATTDAAGEYYFSSLDTPLTPNGEFRVKFTKPADGATVDLGGDHGLVDWANLRLTDQIQGSNTSIDSNADPASGITPPIQTGGPGADDHTIDAGYTLPPLPSYGHAKTSVPVAGTPVQAGDTITYTVTGSNTGEIALEVDILD